MPYKPKVGEEFPVAGAKEKTQYLIESTRSKIAMAVVGAAMLSLLLTVSICAYRGEFTSLLTVWAVVGPILTWIFGYYFRGSEQGDEDHTSTA
jgi:hypothetical protein